MTCRPRKSTRASGVSSSGSSSTGAPSPAPGRHFLPSLPPTPLSRFSSFLLSAGHGAATCICNVMGRARVCAFNQRLRLFRSTGTPQFSCVHTDAQILAVGLLAFLLARATAAPLIEAPTAFPSGGTSSEEETEPSSLLSSSDVWDSILATAKVHQKAFEDEFQNNVEFHLLEDYKVPQLPPNCPNSNFSKEACLHRLAQGLSIYTSLLKHVEKDYPDSRILSEAKQYTAILLWNIKQKMKKTEEVTSLSNSQEESLLASLDNPDVFHRKMTAHSILRQLYIFMVDGKRALSRKDRRRGRPAKVAVQYVVGVTSATEPGSGKMGKTQSKLREVVVVAAVRCRNPLTGMMMYLSVFE
ncbi:LOW QUALITY PROTEIN: interleukin-6 [Festucalex cinctus]